MKQKKIREKKSKIDAVIKNAGEVIEQNISDTLEKNYMPYAMSVIISRAIPEIDGFKPSHRKLLYTMYKMGLLNGARTKSANVVGQTMKLNPHGDAAIYETMVRLTRGNESLLHPYVDSKGNFGKSYSRDMMYAASRYTEVKLDNLCNELFRDIDKDTIDFINNYDNTMLEPLLLPATFPTVLVNANTGIAVGMASSICPFNLTEICETTINLIKDDNHDINLTLKAPDFPTGGQIIYNRAELDKIYETGRGGIKVRSRYTYDKSCNCIDITQIPPTTTIEAIIEKVVALVKLGKIKEISDIRDETGLDGLKITIDLKRAVDPDKLMLKLYKMTPLEDTFSCNFNILIAGMPKVLGVKDILTEWIAFRTECIKRRIYFDLNKKKEKLHLLKGLSKILLDIDKAIKIVRETESEIEVIPNLMIGFGIDQIQAEYVAEIKLRNLNKEYILKRIAEIDQLINDIAEMEDILKSQSKIKKIIITELNDTIKKYGKPRKSMIIYIDKEEMIEEEIPDYLVTIFFSHHGYFKKITPISLRMSSEQKLKEGDMVTQVVEATNNSELIFFTDQHNAYKARVSDFEDTKASVLGEYIAAKLNMDENENVIYMICLKEYKGYVIAVFENGKVAKIDMASYETKTNRKKLIKAYSNKSPLVKLFYIEEDKEMMIKSADQRLLIFSTGNILAKSTRDTIGVQIINLKKNKTVEKVYTSVGDDFVNKNRYRTKSLPAAGMIVSGEDLAEQLTLEP